MLIHPDVETAIRLCLRHNRPFVAYSAPGSSTLHFHSSGTTVECPGNRHFIISAFNSPVSEMLHIPLTHNAAETISLLADTIPSLPTYPSPLPPKPTTHSSYTAGLARVISHLRTHGGKCVISRAICGQYTDEADWIGFAKEYFNTYPDTHRYFYHRPGHGLWPPRNCCYATTAPQCACQPSPLPEPALPEANSRGMKKTLRSTILLRIL